MNKNIPSSGGPEPRPMYGVWPPPRQRPYTRDARHTQSQTRGPGNATRSSKVQEYAATPHGSICVTRCCRRTHSLCTADCSTRDHARGWRALRTFGLTASPPCARVAGPRRAASGPNMCCHQQSLILAATRRLSAPSSQDVFSGAQASREGGWLGL